jgi:hypothetical protein
MNTLKTVLVVAGAAVMFVGAFASSLILIYTLVLGWGDMSSYPPAAVFGLIGLALTYVVDYVIREPIVLVLPALVASLWYAFTHRG